MRFTYLFTLGLLLATLGAPAAFAAAPVTDITWYGHAAFKLTTPSGKVLFIDPWIKNPANPQGAQTLAAIDKADLILVTHGHFDHIGDSAEIAQKTGAKLVATFDLGKAMIQYAGFPEGQFGFDTTGAIGGQISLLDGEVQVAFVPAVHGSTLEAGPESKLPGSLRPHPLPYRRYRPLLRHGADPRLRPGRRHAAVHRRPFHHGPPPRRQSGRAGPTPPRHPHALRHLPGPHRHPGGFCHRDESAAEKGAENDGEGAEGGGNPGLAAALE
jgi:hypothetical protein